MLLLCSAGNVSQKGRQLNTHNTHTNINTCMRCTKTRRHHINIRERARERSTTKCDGDKTSFMNICEAYVYNIYVLCKLSSQQHISFESDSRSRFTTLFRQFGDWPTDEQSSSKVKWVSCGVAELVSRYSTFFCYFAMNQSAHISE